MKHFFQLIRWQNLLIIILSLGLFRWLATPLPSMPLESYCLMILGTVFIAAAGNIINDILDLEIDLINKPNQVIIPQYISVSTAWKIYFLLNFGAILIAFWIGNIALGILYFVAIICLFFYSKIWKKQALIGNLIVALLCAWVVLEYWLMEHTQLTPYWEFILTTYALFAFLTTLSREVIKDIQDVQGDRKMGCKTLVIRVGEKKAKAVVYASFIILLLVLFLESLLFCNNNNMLAFGFTFFGLILLLFVLFYYTVVANKKEQYQQLSLALKVYMLLGLFLLFLV